MYRRLPTICSRFAALIVLLAVMVGIPQHAAGIVFHSTSDPEFNTSAPGGELTDAGWDLQGRWGNYLGTPIAPNLFVTAKHVGGAVGSIFHFRGVDYTTIDSFASPSSDLRIFRVCGTFPDFAPLYDTSDELGRDLVVFGRGTQRGVEVFGQGLVGQELKGWRWGSTDRVQRWGENVVSAIEDGEGNVGELLGADFNADAGMNEGHLSSGDSGGAVFIEKDGEWKLAGINYAVDGPYNTSATGGGFNAVIFDQGGLYTKPDNDWVLQPNLPIDQPGAFYATRISSNIDWIQGIIDIHTGTELPVLQFTTDLNETFSSHPAYAVDEGAMTITLALPSESVFLRLNDCSGVEIISSRIIDGNWVITYGPQD